MSFLSMQFNTGKERDAATTTLWVVLSTVSAVYLWRRVQRYRLYVKRINDIPGPSWDDMHPIFGHFKSLMDTFGTIPNRPKSVNLVGWYLPRLPQYKDKGIFRAWMFHPFYLPFLCRNGVLILEPKWIRQLLTEKAYYQCLDKEKRIYTIAKSLIGSSFLALSDGPEWKHQRKMAAPAFNAHFVQHVHDTVLKLLEDHVFPLYDNNNKNASKEPFVTAHRLEATEWSARFTMDVLGLVAFSYYFGAVESFTAAQRQQVEQQHVSEDNGKTSHGNSNSSSSTEGDTLYDDFVTILSTVALRNISPLPFRQYLPTQENRLFGQATKRLDGTIHKIVEERLRMEQEQEQSGHLANGRSAPNNENETKQGTPQDILSYMLKRDPDTGKRMSQHVLFANVRMLLFAGHDTTASTVAWALWELSNNPEIQEKLYAEIASVSRDSTPKWSYKTIAALPYLDAVVRESLRLHCPAPIGRVVTKDIELRHPTDTDRTVLLPKGAKLFMIPLYVHRLYAPQLGDSTSDNVNEMEEGNRFYPERFLVRQNNKGSPSAGQHWFLPFSVGPRNW